MGKTARLTDMFFEDARRFIRELSSFAEMLKETPERQDIIDNAFRAAHSIKSESAYLRYQSIADECNNLENLLESYKDRSLTPEVHDRLRRGIEALEELVEKERGRPREEEGKREGGKNLTFQFNDFEQQLIREAKERREDLYRLYCEIDPSEKMVYPRLFLLISNLEMEVNVIKTVPELSEEIEPDQDIQIFFSSALDEKEIYRLISIDQIARTELTRLNYNSIFRVKQKQAGQEQREYPEPQVLRVDSAKFEELKSGIEEVELFARELAAGTEAPEFRDNPNIIKIGELTGHISRVMQRLYLISLRDELEALKTFAVDLAAKLGKKIEVSITGANFEVDTRFVDILSDVLVHLVRNAVDHGIEEPKERGMFQKEETGTLVLSAFKHGDRAVIQVLDDGKGIVADEIRDQAEKQGISGGSKGKQDLLEVLTRPGFTTLRTATGDSGRGYGLDIAAGRLREIPRAEMRMCGRPGSGTVFTIVIPAGFTNVELVVAKHSDRQICFQKNYIVSIQPVNQEEFAAGAGGKLEYRGLPVFTEHGRITRADAAPAEKYAVEMEYLDKRGIVLVDEVLFEKEIFERQIVKNREIEPHLYALSLGGQENYYVVSPSLILHA
jgi:two-component system, chemotaxis family, sensor kinase CheA